MNALIVTVIATMVASAAAAPSISGVVLSGPAGVVTDHGAIGPAGGYGYDDGGLAVGAHGVYAAVAAPEAVAPVEWGLHGAVGAITNGGGTIGASSHGATIAGPPTVRVIIKGPAGQIVADGLWGPTWNLGHGHGR